MNNRESLGTISSALSAIVMPHKGGDDLAEIRLPKGGSIVVGQYPFVGYVDDEKKVIHSFSDNSDYSHFYQAYKALAEECDYEIRQVNPVVQKYYSSGRPYTVHEGPTVAEFLSDPEHDILAQVLGVLNGELEATGGVTASRSTLDDGVDTLASSAQGSEIYTEFNQAKAQSPYQLICVSADPEMRMQAPSTLSVRPGVKPVPALALV